MGAPSQRLRNNALKQGPCEQVQWVRELAAKPGNLSLIVGTHMVQVENPVLKMVLELPHMYHGRHMYTHELFKYIYY